MFEYNSTEKNICLKSSIIQKDTAVACVDVSKIKLVISNLVDNAIKFTPNNGQIIISLINEDDILKIMVTDTGPGIKPNEQDKIFNRFYQVDSPLTHQVGGTGIGLNIVKEYVKKHNGQVWVKNNPTKGCTFTFTLPKQNKL